MPLLRACISHLEMSAVQRSFLLEISVADSMQNCT